MKKRYARLQLLCILELVLILFLTSYIVFLRITAKDNSEETTNTGVTDNTVSQISQNIAEKYPYADPSHAIFAKGDDRYTVDGTMCKRGEKIDFIGEVEFKVDNYGCPISWNVDYEIYMSGDGEIYDAFRELSENGYNKAVIYGNIFENGFTKKLMPEYLIIYSE